MVSLSKKFLGPVLAISLTSIPNTLYSSGKGCIENNSFKMDMIEDIVQKSESHGLDRKATAKFIVEAFPSRLGNYFKDRSCLESYHGRTSRKDVIMEILRQAELYEVDATTALKIAYHESDFETCARNPGVPSINGNRKGNDRGVFQFINGSWEYYGEKYWKEDFWKKNRFDYLDNIELAMKIMSLRGSSSWNESKHCWDK